MNLEIPLAQSNAPWIIGREPLFKDALEDFEGELTRTEPWNKARIISALESLEAQLEADLGMPASLQALTRTDIATWFKKLEHEDYNQALLALEAFGEYLVAWGWTSQIPWR